MRITPSEKSLSLTRAIAEDIPTFHHHYHILWDIREQFYADTPVTYLEIGTYAGASAALMLSYHKPTFAYSIDVGTPIPQKTCEENISPYIRPGSTHTYLKGNSKNKNIRDTVSKVLSNAVDILFIDGDHSETAVALDFFNYAPLVKQGGFVVFDDYEDAQSSPDVKKAVNKIVPKVYDDFDIYTLPANTLSAKPKELQLYNEFILRRK